MKLMLVGDWSRSTIDEIGSKFLSGEDVNPAEGVTMVARWHDLTSKKVWVVFETDDAARVQSWAGAWSNYLDWELHSIVDDETVGEIIGSILQ